MNKYNEALYFEELMETDKFVFDSFRERIRYFHPAFHSTTPEGLNSRLTFLNQCTRQGPTMESQAANNLAFGRAPVCILRLGDFYNTKIIIDSINFEFEPLVWDLNPEGIGVQPMIANVSISFKFIGGSTLVGPLQKLQNALSFNYYANTQVYDTRADYFVKNDKVTTVKRFGDKEDDKTNDRQFANYDLVNGNPNASQDVIIEDVVTTIKENQDFDTDQEIEAIKDLIQEIPESGSTANVIVSGIYIKDNITIIDKSADGTTWPIKAKLTTLTNLTDPTLIAQNLLNQGNWSFRVRDVNSNESFQNSMSEGRMIAAVTPISDEISFQIEIKNAPTPKGTFNVGSSVGINNSIGRENFILEILLNNTSLHKMNIKLK